LCIEGVLDGLLHSNNLDLVFKPVVLDVVIDKEKTRQATDRDERDDNPKVAHRHRLQVGSLLLLDILNDVLGELVEALQEDHLVGVVLVVEQRVPVVDGCVRAVVHYRALKVNQLPVGSIGRVEKKLGDVDTPEAFGHLRVLFLNFFDARNDTIDGRVDVSDVYEVSRHPPQVARQRAEPRRRRQHFVIVLDLAHKLTVEGRNKNNNKKKKKKKDKNNNKKKDKKKDKNKNKNKKKDKNKKEKKEKKDKKKSKKHDGD